MGTKSEVGGSEYFALACLSHKGLQWAQEAPQTTEQAAVRDGGKESNKHVLCGPRPVPQPRRAGTKRKTMSRD